MKNFEDKLTKLKKIVDDLETGDVSLDESLKQFELGTKLITDCYKQLEEFQKKITVLVENSKGDIEQKEFESDKD